MVLRAKDKDFNAEMKTDFDESDWKNKYHSTGYWKGVFEFIQQCFLRSKRTKKNKKSISYEPTVSVSTKKCRK